MNAMARFLILLTIGLSCTQDPSGVGTILNNPTLPKPNLIPDFDNYVPEASLGGSSSESTDAAISSNTKSLSLQSETDDSASGAAADWTEVFIDGGVGESRALRSTMREFGKTALDALTAAGITEATDEVQTASLGYLTIFDTTANWNVDYVAETSLDTGEPYVRMLFKNLDYDPTNIYGIIQASYVFKIENDLPVKGIFAYVNPQLLSETANSGTRIVAFAFDFTESDRNLLVMRTESYDEDVADYRTYHAHYQCDLTSQNCSGQYVEIASPAPERSFTRTLRYDWRDASRAICLANVTFGESDVTIGTTQSFTGPDEPTSDQITEGGCSLTPEAYWYDYVYTTEKLPKRYLDTTPAGGTALAYFIDGTRREGWDLLVPNLIDRWLRGEEF